MSIICCPKCKLPVQRIDRMLRCAAGHSYDYAKEGYINLLLANKKNTSNPGDNKVMINAREAFLSAGYYDFLWQGIESSIRSPSTFSLNQNQQILDLGCGSGYYTRNLWKEEEVNKIGIDISKVAVAKAAKKDKWSTYVVASNFDIPVVDHSVDLVLNIFSPIALKELGRVLKPGGIFVKVVPSGDHMKEIAEQVYNKFIPHESSIESEIESDGNLEILKIEELKNRMNLSGQLLHDFISMTPYLYKFRDGQLEALQELSVTLSFKMIVGKSG